MDKLLQTDQTDELIRSAATDGDGAIEDCEVRTGTVVYFFEAGTVGTVNRSTGAVTFTGRCG